MTAPLVEVHCPTCVRTNDAAVVLSVPLTLRFAVVAQLRPGDAVHACGQCPTCKAVVCLITERRGVSRIPNQEAA